MAISHTVPARDDSRYEAAMAKYSTPERDAEEKLQIEMQHNALFVWVLSNDGSADLSK